MRKKKKQEFHNKLCDKGLSVLVNYSLDKTLIPTLSQKTIEL